MTKQAYAKDVWFDDNNLWVLLMDGRQLSIPLSYFPRLLNASEKERNDFIISGGGIGIHWDKIDEDILVEGLFLGFGDRTNKEKGLV